MSTASDYYDLFGRIFDQPFRTKVPMNATMSPAWIKNNGGMYVSGTKYWDEQINNQLQDGYLTISKMVDYARKGVAIIIVRPSDTKRIYDSIQAYLKHAQQVFSSFVDPGAYSDTLEDLRDLDRLANVVYKHAKWHEPSAPSGNQFVDYLRGFSGFDFYNLNQAPKSTEENIHERQYSSMEKMFTGMIDPDRLEYPDNNHSVEPEVFNSDEVSDDPYDLGRL